MDDAARELGGGLLGVVAEQAQEKTRVQVESAVYLYQYQSLKPGALSSARVKLAPPPHLGDVAHGDDVLEGWAVLGHGGEDLGVVAQASI